jgi:hypothetical protein
LPSWSCGGCRWLPEAVTDTSRRERLALTLPCVRLEPIDDTGAFVQIDQPRRVAALLIG